MKLNEYSIQEVASALGIRTKNDRFSHNCTEKGIDPTEKNYAKLNANNSFYCYRCFSENERSIGFNMDLVKDTLGIDTLKEINDWGKENLIDFTPEFTEVDSQSSFPVFASELASYAHKELVENTRAKAWIKQKYGVTEDSLVNFTVGLVTEDVVANFSDSLVSRHSLKRYVGYICIPIILEGVVASLTMRRCDSGEFNHTHDAKKYSRLNNISEAPEPVFGYDAVKNYLNDNKNSTNPLIICESEFDAILLHQIQERYAISVSSTTAFSLYQRALIAKLSKKASCTITMFDNDGHDLRKNAGVKGAESLIFKMFERGCDLKQIILPIEDDETKIDVCDFILKRPDGVNKIKALIYSCVMEQPTFLHTFIENNRVNFKKDEVVDKIVSSISRLPRRDWDAYVSQISTVPKHLRNQKNTSLLKIGKSSIMKQLTLKQRMLQKESKETELSFSDVDDDDMFRFYSQDYWVDRETGLFHAKKMVYANIDKTVFSDDGEAVKKSVRMPVEIEMKSTESGIVSIEKIDTLDPDSLDLEQSRRMPEDHDRFNDLKTWTARGDSPYSFKSFKESKGTLKIDAEELYAEIYDLCKKYFYFANEVYYDLVPSYIMMTYVYMMLPAVPYIHFCGMKGTGKSAVADFMGKLSFRTSKSSNAAANHLFRVIHAERGLFLLDEAEDMNGVKMSDRTKELVSLCNASYAKDGAMVPKNVPTKTGGFATEWYYAYGPKMFMSTKSLIDTLRSRCIRFETVSIPKKLLSDFPSFEDDLLVLSPFIQQIRDKLNIWSLTDYALFFKEYRDMSAYLKTSKGVGNRDLQLWRPMLSIMKLCGRHEAVDKTIELIQDLKKRDNNVIATSDFSEIFRVLDSILKEYEDAPNKMLSMQKIGDHYYAVRGAFDKDLVDRLYNVSGGQSKYLSDPRGAIPAIFTPLRLQSVVETINCSMRLQKSGRHEGFKRGRIVYKISAKAVEAKIQEIEDLTTDEETK